jgi:gluconokinase
MIVIVMGVTGSGKTTVGQMLAQQMGWEFADADSFHSEKNIEKMRQGIALDDEDRAPWLASLRTAIVNWIAQKKSVVLACSALKKRYRAELQVGAEVKFVYLKGSRELIEERLRARHGHFAGDSILAGQFADLEEPEGAIVVDVASSPERIVGEIRERLNRQ